MSRPSLVIVLAEDARQQSFIRRYLYNVGYERHVIRFTDLPNGRHSGERWVRLKYASEVEAFRRRSSKARTALVVAIDADTEAVDRRHYQLQAALDEAGITPRANDEAIVHLVPKRNVETWILCLSNREVDEVTDYKRDPEIDALIPTAATTLFQWTRQNTAVPALCVPSLRAAITETERLELTERA